MCASVRFSLVGGESKFVQLSGAGPDGIDTSSAFFDSESSRPSKLRDLLGVLGVLDKARDEIGVTDPLRDG